MEFEQTPIKDLYIAKSKKIGDDRGNFMRMFCFDSLKEQIDIERNIKQINLSFTKEKGTVRGMHFQQSPALESKIVRCIEGKIMDVAVDLRKGSDTYLKHFAVELSEENNLALIIPEGFAHGFQALKDNCKMVYIHGTSYAPEHEGGLRFDDPKLVIKWPLEPKNMSERDLSFKLLSERDFKGL